MDSDSESDDDFYLLFEKERQLKRYLRDYDNPLEFYTEEDFQRRFRFSKDTITEVIFPLVSDYLKTTSNRGLPLLPLYQLLLAIRFYATGSFQRVVGDLVKVSQPTSCRIINRISRLLAGLLHQHVSFPNGAAQISMNRQRFYAIANFPGVAACIDGTHIPVENPGGEHAEVYRNRKGRFSINVQAAVGPNQEFLDVVVRYPGSTHDARIFDNSALRIKCEQGQIRGVLLGDSGYPCRDYLLTPVHNPVTQAEERYNASHIRTRNIVERTFGVWKRRFPCLKRGLTNKLGNCVAIICATVVLHNIARQTNEPEPDDDLEDDSTQNDQPNEYRQRNNRFRQHLIDTHFS